MNTNKLYEKKQAQWKKPLERKKLARARREQREAEKEPIEDMDAVVYVHSPEKGVALPPHPDDIFAVIRLLGKQIKVLNSDLILVEKLPFEVGQQICISDVLMVGTIDYTAIGRPQVENARVYATIEEEAQCEKVIIFKKRRRKGYQKSQGHRQTTMVLRVDRIEHDLTADDFSLEAQKAGKMALMQTPTESRNIII